MNEPQVTPIQFFQPKEDYAVVQRRLPHWSQAGTVSFITWRTWDSIPQRVLNAWLADRWRIQPSSLDADSSREFRRQMSDRWNEHLDTCHGACVLKRPDLAQVVASSLLHFDGIRYELLDFVVMPNHVHVLATFYDETAMLKQCQSWKHFTATELNRRLARKGRFWQQEDFDHLVRSPDQFDYLRHYIAANPARSRLKSGEFVYWSKTRL